MEKKATYLLVHQLVVQLIHLHLNIFLKQLEQTTPRSSHHIQVETEKKICKNNKYIPHVNPFVIQLNQSSYSVLLSITHFHTLFITLISYPLSSDDCWTCSMWCAWWCVGVIHQVVVQAGRRCRVNWWIVCAVCCVVTAAVNPSCREGTCMFVCWVNQSIIAPLSFPLVSFIHISMIMSFMCLVFSRLHFILYFLISKYHS